MTKDEMKNKISMALKDPILQQGFEIICKNLAELEKENETVSRKANKAIADKLLITATYNEVLNDLNQENDKVQKENAELTCQMKRNIYCYSCKNATEKCYKKEIGCPCGKYKSYKDENTELEKENTRLKEKWLQATDEGTSWAHLKSLERENEELKKQQFSLRNERNTFLAQNEQYEKDLIDFNENLTKAKEIIENIIRVTWGEGWNYSLDWKVKAEQFLNSEVEK